MNQPRYQLEAEKSLMIFEFISDGPKGRIPKIVKFSETNLKGLYNLAFGDKNIETGEIDDKIVSNNSDSEMVLATVVAAIYGFTDKYPNCWVYVTGSNKARTRLYRMGITKYIMEAKKDFIVLGQKEKSWKNFRIGIDYEAFLVKRKKK